MTEPDITFVASDNRVTRRSDAVSPRTASRLSASRPAAAGSRFLGNYLPVDDRRSNF